MARNGVGAPLSPARPSAGVGSPDGVPQNVASAGSRADTPTVPIPTAGHISAPPLRMPLDHVDAEAMKSVFQERRGSRRHAAAGLLAPRPTPLHAVHTGTIPKLSVSQPGGLTFYRFGPAEQAWPYYA